EGLFPFVAEGGMAEVMGQRDCLCEVLIQPEGARDIAGNAGHFQRMSQPRAEVVARAVQENLRLVLQPAKRARVDHAVPVPVEMRAAFRRVFWVFAPACLGAELGVRRQKLALALLQFLAGARHQVKSNSSLRRIAMTLLQNLPK